MKAERLIQPEFLDDALDDENVRRNLADIAWINRWLGGHGVLRGAFARLAPAREFTVLDVGAASGDNGRALRSRWPGVRVTSLDLHRRNLAQADAPRVQADAFRLPFGPGSFDFVSCSLFLHHFSDAEVVRLLKSFARTARQGVVVTDLERHPLAHRFLPATRSLLGWGDLTLHDGPVSVQAAFTQAEFRDLACRAGLARAEVRRHLPWFRLSLVCAL